MTPDTHKANYCQVGPHEIRKLLTVKKKKSRKAIKETAYKQGDNLYLLCSYKELISVIFQEPNNMNL